MLFYAAAALGFVITLPGDLFFWAIDSAQMIQDPAICRSSDQTIGDYLVKGQWTNAPWRPVCKEE
jgi:hypothetical protein